MKIPRYLQLMLAATAVICLWSGFSEENIDDEPLLSPHPSSEISARPPVTAEPAKSVNGQRNLFPFQGKVEKPRVPAPVTVKAPKVEAPRAPQLPFKLAGAWWSKNQHLLVVSNGQQSWIVCRTCNVKESIRPGQKLDNNWQLMEITDDYLTFRWLPLETDQRLSLGNMKSKPEF